MEQTYIMVGVRTADSQEVSLSKKPTHQAHKVCFVVQIKPDGVQRGLVGEIIKRFEQKGYYLRALKYINVPKELAEEHYVDLASKPFYSSLVEYIIR